MKRNLYVILVIVSAILLFTSVTVTQFSASIWFRLVITVPVAAMLSAACAWALIELRNYDDGLRRIIETLQAAVQGHEVRAALAVATEHLARRRGQTGAKRGPKGTPEAERAAIINEWLEVESDETQEAFCARKGIGVSTLRAWKSELLARGIIQAN